MILILIMSKSEAVKKSFMNKEGAMLIMLGIETTYLEEKN